MAAFRHHKQGLMTAMFVKQVLHALRQYYHACKEDIPSRHKALWSWQAAWCSR